MASRADVVPTGNQQGRKEVKHMHDITITPEKAAAVRAFFDRTMSYDTTIWNCYHLDEHTTIYWMRSKDAWRILYNKISASLLTLKDGTLVLKIIDYERTKYLWCVDIVINHIIDTLAMSSIITSRTFDVERYFNLRHDNHVGQCNDLYFVNVCTGYMDKRTRHDQK